MSARPIVAVVDYGAGNLVSIEQALTTVGADVLMVSRWRGDPRCRRPRGPWRRCGGTGDGPPRLARPDRADPRLAGRRPTVPRYLPWAAAAVRRKRRGRRDDPRCRARPDRAPRGRADPPPHRLEPGRAFSPARRSSTGSTTRPISTSSTRTPVSPTRLPTTWSWPRPSTAHGSSRRSRAARWWVSSSTLSGAAPTGCVYCPTSSISFERPDAAAARHPLPRRRRRTGRQGHPVRRPRRRGRSAGTGRALRRRGRRRACLPRHQCGARTTRHAPRCRRADGSADVHPADGRRRRANRRRDARRPARGGRQGLAQHGRRRRPDPHQSLRVALRPAGRGRRDRRAHRHLVSRGP